MMQFLVKEDAAVDIPDVLDSENPTALRVVIQSKKWTRRGIHFNS